MKSMRKPLIVLAAFAVAIEIFAGCATTRVKPVQKTEVLDDKGAAFGIQPPEWVTAYLAQNNTGVEKLSAYKDKYCFVVAKNDASRDFAVAWVQNASGPQAIAAKISTTVVASVSNSLSGEKGGNVEENIKAAAEQLSNASFNGATKESDWWQIVRNKATNVQECRAYALWVINRKQLDQQVAANLQNIVDKNAAMSAAERAIYADLISQIRSSGGIFND